ncbi:MAG: sigma-54 dependent transcriptional regulator [Myxococcota bacterium]
MEQRKNFAILGNDDVCQICQLTTVTDGLRRKVRVVAESPAMHALLRRAAPMAAADASVIILGESGTGKEVLARTLHENSPRRRQPFVAVNVAALPTELLESELFGHVKGAFTGALAARRGLMEAAAGGTLFLDEIAEMPLPLQAKLLRALQDGEVRRVGDTQAFSVDVRVICATHRDLRSQVERGLFREDLYYRLKVFSLTVPPLRERREDILPLTRVFLELESRANAVLTPDAERALVQHRWPGNVRELANAVKHGVALSLGGAITSSHLPDDVLQPAPSRPADAPVVLRPLAEVEREHVLHVLQACGGRPSEAARVLGIGRNTLWRKLRGYGVAIDG